MKKDAVKGKLKVVQEILAFKASCDGFPNLKLSNSLPSINKLLDVIAFLMDLIKSVVGLEALKDKLINMLSYEMEGFELAIKKVLKTLIKEVFSCSISPTIPMDLITTGIDVDLSRIDFFNILKVNPDSVEGSILFGDPNKDFNYFLSDTVELGTPNNWKNLLIVTYSPTGIVDGEVKNDVINIKIDPSYTNKSVFTFLNKFIDSIRFLPEANTVPNIINTVFGTISSVAGKNFITLKQDAEFETLMNKILSNYDDTQVELDNTFIEFSNEERFKIEERALELQNGTVILKECEYAPSKVNLSSIQDLLVSLSGATTSGERKTILTKHLKILADESTENVGDENKKLGELTFFLNLIKGLVLVILKSIAGPAMILIFCIYLKLAYNTLNFNDLKEFIKTNLKFYLDMVKKIIIDTIQKTLLSFLFNVLKELIICNFTKNLKQTQKQYQLSLAGLSGKAKFDQIELINKIASLGIGI
jgi:hypothetical protein